MLAAGEAALGASRVVDVDERSLAGLKDLWLLAAREAARRVSSVVDLDEGSLKELRLLAAREGEEREGEAAAARVANDQAVGGAVSVLFYDAHTAGSEAGSNCKTAKRKKMRHPR